MVGMMFGIILVAQLMTGIAARMALERYDDGGDPVYVVLALLGAVEIFALAWLSAQVA